MLKALLTTVSLVIVLAVQAQVIDCNSPRFDQEVFSTVNVTSNVVFGANIDANGNNLILKMDIYQPAGDTMVARPLIVWAHGGSFLSGSKLDNDVAALCQRFAKRGYVCASIDYRLGIPLPINSTNATKAVFRAVQDLKAAIRFFRQDAATTNTYQIDPTIIYAGGSSAGAFMALHLAYLDEVSEIPAVVDTNVLGGLEGNSGNPGYSSSVNAIIDLCGAIGDKTWMKATDIPFCAMHGNVDNTVPYGTAIIYLLGTFPIMVVDGSYSAAGYADTIGLYNKMYTFYGANHVPYASNAAYMDTTVSFVSNFLYEDLGCQPRDPFPLPNTFPTSIATTNTANAFTLFPNPATQHITISGNQPIRNLKLFDLSGKTLTTLNNIGFSTDLTISSYPPGVYFLRLTTAVGSEVKKFIVQ